MPLDLTSQTFGRLTVLSYAGKDERGNHCWTCLCTCGNPKQKTTSQLRDKAARNISCGCSQLESIRKAHAAAIKVTTKFQHPLKLKLKWLWRNMMCRCYKPDNKRYSDYGGRGITVCEEWRNDRYAFYKWCLDNGADWHLQIDRKDNDGPYSPDNCKFSTKIEQANNTRKNRFLTWDGQRRTVSQWARIMGVDPRAVQHRVDHGWTTERIFTQKFRVR